VLRPIQASNNNAESVAPAGTDDATPEELFMVREFFPWVKSVDDARKCMKFMVENEKLNFNLEKAERVMSELKASHWALYRERLPFETPKTWPGMQLVLQRCSDRIN